jgi:phosphoenolpyruvate-protein kinase (PTS system EI component)
MPGEPFAVPILVGLGVDELNMNALTIPVVKQMARCLEFLSVKVLAQDALAVDSPRWVIDAVEKIFRKS